jgi:hypothetical protein
MNVWVTLLATVAGAVIALAGQYILKRGEKRTRSGELLLEQCAQVIALSEDLRNRVWEEQELHAQGRVDAWDLGAHRIAAARVKILCQDPALLNALEDLTNSGKQLSGYWRLGKAGPDKIENLRELDKVAIAEFIKASAVVVRRYLGEA